MSDRAHRVQRPVPSGIAKRVCRRSAQTCCPFNIKFAQELKEPAFKPRELLANKDAKTLAEDLLAMEQADFSAAFRKSPMNRAKLAGLQRNARVVLGRGDTGGDADAL
jgi:epoxyqueuosine reductase